jgi:hypothetical protein
MRCPYHPGREAVIPIPVVLEEPSGWLGWMEDCCGLVAWRCERGGLSPIEARFCTFHGCERPRLNRIAHEWTAGDGSLSRVSPPPLVHRALELTPMGGGNSAPCLAGNVLVYLTDSGRLVALDMGGEAALSLASNVRAASVQLSGSAVEAALQTDAGVRHLSWSVRDLRDGLSGIASVEGTPLKSGGARLLGLPAERTRLHRGVGALRLVVTHDPIEDERILATYRGVSGAAPGDWVIEATPNPDGPPVYCTRLRPQALLQVPCPVPGGMLVLGTVRHRGVSLAGALLIPTVGRRDEAA